MDRELTEYDLKTIETNPSPDVFESEEFEEKKIDVCFLEIEWL